MAMGPTGDLVAWVAEQRARREDQLALRRLNRVVLVGQGPGAVTGGWSIGSDEWVRCVVCGYLLHLDGVTTDQCWCRAMTSDADAGRIGSDLGDEAVERVRLEPLEG